MTLVEMLVVLAIIGMLFGMGLPAITRYTRQMRLKATTRQLVGLISLARSTAISAHEDHAVVIDQGAGLPCPARKDIKTPRDQRPLSSSAA